MKHYSIIFKNHQPTMIRHYKVEDPKSFSESKAYEPGKNVIINKDIHAYIVDRCEHARSTLDTINQLEKYDNLGVVSLSGLSFTIVVNDNNTIAVSNFHLDQKMYVDSLVMHAKNFNYKRIITCNLICQIYDDDNSEYIANITVFTKKEIYKILSTERERILLLDGNVVYDTYTYNLFERPKISFIGGAGDSDYENESIVIPGIFLNYDCFDV